ncbi:MAG: SMUG2 DNA glycosylase family protein [Bacteroidetes bacterium]|nr:SMUG2 DNA glycosylase family protein [Bacteroidota bacterium]
MKQTTFGERVIDFNTKLSYSGRLPTNFSVMNPYIENPETKKVMTAFYHKYYHDFRERKFIIGINPSRHGAGVTGVPFTDTKRLEQACGIVMKSAHTHEVSSVFMYDMIAQFGGTDEFYRQYYINSPFPLAIIRHNVSGQWLNANYYDDPTLFEMVKPFMIESLKKHISLGLETDVVYVLGRKNAQFLEKINLEQKLFAQMQVLEHPRYIQQYKFHARQEFIDKYITVLTQ